MRLLSACLVCAAVLVPIQALPLSFEQRSAGQFRTRLNSGLAIVQADRVSFGALTVQFVGASPDARLEGLGTAAPSTYLIAGFHQTFRQFPKLAIRGLYPGIDAVFYGDQEHLEYDLVLAPGASSRPLRLSFDGARSLRLDREGNLVVDGPSGRLLQKLPKVFQHDGTSIAANYILRAHHQVELRLGRYDRRQRLTIDPELAFTRYFGGSGTDNATAIATDAQGNIYIAGTSNSVDFPTTNGLQAKISPPLVAFPAPNQAAVPLPVGVENSVTAVGGSRDGSVIYAATPGGVYVSGDHGATWRKGGMLIGPPLSSGSSGSSGITGVLAPVPVIANIAVDPLDPSVVFIATSRGLFFSSDAGQDWGLHNYGLAANYDGSVNVSSVITNPVDRSAMYATTGNPMGLFKSTDDGNTWKPLNVTYPGEPPLPYTPFSPIVATLAPNGTDLYVVDTSGTLLKSIDGGTTFQALAQGLFGTHGLAFDPTNPSTLYVYDNYGLQKSVDGGETFGTLFSLLPGNGRNPVQQLAVDASGNLYVGSTQGVFLSADGGVTVNMVASTPNLHTLAALGSQVYAGFDTPSSVFITKFDPTGSKILYSTFLGAGNGNISGLAVDAQGNCTIAGNAGPGYPTTVTLGNPPSLQYVTGGFVSRLNADGTQLLYSTLISGSQGAYLAALALDTSGSAYVTGETASADFPITPNAVQHALPASMCTRPSVSPFILTNTGQNAFVSKLSADGATLVWSTFLTGSCGSEGIAIAVSAAGEPIVGGYTTSPDFPATANSYQAAFPGNPNQIAQPNALYAGFITRLSAGGDQILASTYLGGGYSTTVSALAIDASGNIAAAGSTSGIAPGATPGAYKMAFAEQCYPIINIGPGPPPAPPTDAFVLRIDPSLSTARYLTYLGGSCSDSVTGLALDSAGNTWVTGYTQSPDYPLKAPYQAQGATFNARVVSELNASGSQLLFSSGTDGVALALDSAGAAYLAGNRNGAPMAGELIKIDPANTPPVVIDRVTPSTGFPTTTYQPSGLQTGLAPGELIRITGQNLGPASKINGQLDANGRLPFSLANTTVLFNGVPAALLSVQAGEIDCFVPFEASAPLNLVVEAGGQMSNSVRLGVASSDVQILSIANQDGTPNSAANPAQPGSVLVIYVSGLGQTNPPGADGLVNPTSTSVPLLPSLNVYFPGVTVKPQYVGSAPGLIAGIMQVNVALPPLKVTSSMVSFSVGSAQGVFYLAQ